MEVNPLKPLTKDQSNELSYLRKRVIMLEKTIKRLDTAKQEGFIKHWDYQRQWETAFSEKAKILDKMRQIRGFED